jgi:hypothetical protein
MALFHQFNMILRLSEATIRTENHSTMSSKNFILYLLLICLRLDALESGRFIVRIMEKTVLTSYVDCLRDGRPKLQQAYLNILIIIFAGGSIHSTPQSQLTSIDESLRSIRYYFLQISNQLFVILCRLLDQGGSIAIKGKAVLAIELICRYQPILLSSLCELRLQNILTKILDVNEITNGAGTELVSQYVTQCAQSFIHLIQYLLSHSVLEIIRELKSVTHITTPRGYKLLVKNTSAPPAPPHSSDISSPKGNREKNQFVTPVKASPGSIKQSKSTPIIGTRAISIPSTPQPVDTFLNNSATVAAATEMREFQSNASVSVLRGCISLISHPSLQKHVVNPRYLYSISTALQLISDILSDRAHYHNQVQPSEEMEFLLLSEQSILLALESVSQV